MIFDYPSGAHERRHGPRGYRAYPEYKPWLRDEFAFRCVYCLRRERFFPDGHQQFGADHLVAQSVEPGRVNDYANLVYACNRCNVYKAGEPLPLSPDAAGYGVHMTVDEQGNIRALTPDGQDLIDALYLDDPVLIELRRRMLTCFHALRTPPEEVPANLRGLMDVAHSLFRYPDDLPDLSRLRPPGGNARPDGTERSHLARRRRGELPESY